MTSGASGNCYDNAVAESWFSTLKSELGEHFESYAQAEEQSFDYFYNHRSDAGALQQRGRGRGAGGAREGHERWRGSEDEKAVLAAFVDGVFEP